MKIVANKRFGGFSISRKAAEYMAKNGSERAKAEIKESKKEGRWYGYGYVDGFDDGYERTDKLLIEAVENLGDKANGEGASLVVLEIPDGIRWEIDNYDGVETIREKHRSW